MVHLTGSVAACLALALLAGCGAGSDASAGNAVSAGGTTAGQTTTGSTANSQTAFADCMRAQGVDIPDPSGANGSAPGQAPTGIDQAALQKGIQACGQYVQGGGAPPAGFGASGVPGGGQAFARCLRKEGITVPDPQAGQAPASGMPSLDSQDPKVQAAVAKCRSASQ